MRYQKENYLLQGEQIENPIDWRGVKVLADFDGNFQPKLSIETLTFVNESLNKIKQHISEGRIFEGMDLQINVTDEDSSLITFNGILDPSTYQQVTPNKAECRIVAKDGLDTLNDRLSSITVLSLYNKGYLRNQTDVNFVVEPKFDAVYFVTTSITIYVLTNALQQAVKENVKDAGLIAGIFSAGFTGSVGAVIATIAVAVANLAYTIVMIVAITKLVKDLIDSFIQPVRTHKAISWGTVLKDTCDYLGYGFNTSIPNLDNWIQLPSNQSNNKTITNGIPKATDYGYILSDFFNQVLVTFNAQIGIIDGVLNIHPVWSDIWLKNSTYKMPSNIPEIEQFTYNTEEIKRSRELIFSFDISENYSDNENYRVQGGGVISQGVDGYKDLLKGYESYQVFHALGNRKDGLTRVENLIKDLGKLADSVINTFGGSSNLANKVKNRIGMLRVSTPNHALSKILYISNGNMPSNHADIVNADNLYKDYYLPSSLSNGGQKKVFEGVEIPFNLKSFNKLKDNPYFIGNNGSLSKVNSLEWGIDKDTAIVSYEEEFRYTNKLREDLI